MQKKIRIKSQRHRISTFASMPKDVRYITIREMIRAKRLNTFADIFDIIPRTVVAADMGFNNNRMRDLIKYPL